MENFLISRLNLFNNSLKAKQEEIRKFMRDDEGFLSDRQSTYRLGVLNGIEIALKTLDKHGL